MSDFWQGKNVVLTGGSGFLGSHLVESLQGLGCNLFYPTSNNYDLRNILQARALLEDFGKIDILLNLAATVGGIGYNQAHPYSLFYDNIQIGVNLIHSAIQHKVGKFVQISTTCAYPKFTSVPFDERCLWDGYPEETNAPYGIAKRVLLTQLQAARQEFGFNGIYILPTNLYGPGDHFEEARSHVIPALIRRFSEAITNQDEEITVWGTGNASRDFLFVKDAVDGIILLAEKYNSDEPVNLGSGEEIRISVLVHFLTKLMGYEGQIRWDRTKPDGQPRRGLRIWKAKELGWQPQTRLKDGLQRTIEWWRANQPA